jgi:hypothetical protein
VLTAVIALLMLIIGLLAGYYARTVRDKVHGLYEMFRDRMETPPGVVKPTVTRGQTRAQQVAEVNLGIEDDEGGGVLRPTPNQVELDRLAEQSMVANEKARRQNVRAIR